MSKSISFQKHIQKQPYNNISLKHFVISDWYAAISTINSLKQLNVF